MADSLDRTAPAVANNRGANALRIAGRFAPAVILAIVASVGVNGFASVPNLIAIVQASAITGIAAVGAAAITISGKFISLSIEQQAIASAYVFAALLNAGQPLVLALVATLIVAALLGAIQGYMVARGLNPIVTTLAFGSVVFGAVVVLSDNRTITLRDNPVSWLGGGLTFGIPNQAIVFVIVLVLGSLFLARTRLGRQLVLTGANERAAELMGIPVRRITIFAFIVAAIAGALVAILVVGQVSQAKSDMFRGLTIDVVAAILVGGIAVQGGEGQLWRAGLGALILTMLGNILLLLGFEAGHRELLKGLLAGAVLLSFWIWKGRSQ